MGLFFSKDRAGEDMLLCEHHAQGFSGGVPVHIGMRIFYIAADQTVYREKSGPDGVNTESWKIPKRVKKTRDGLIAYLNSQGVSLPPM